jgi:fructoselysine 6-kinase
MKIIGVGDNVVDYYKDRGEIYPGGNALNVSVLAKRYGADASSYLGIVGNDDAGEHITNSLREEGVDISRLRTGFGQNWESIISLNEEADRIFIGSNRGTCVQSIMKLNFNQDDFDYLQNYDLLHTSIYSYIESELPELSKHITISFDFSSNVHDEYLKEVCPYVTYGFFSGSDLTKEGCLQLIKKVAAFGLEVIGVTRGAKGAIFYREGKIFEQPIIDTDVVDTLGAGDSFISKFLTYYYQTKDMENALKEAAKAAAATCEIYGAFGHGIPKKVRNLNETV